MKENAAKIIISAIAAGLSTEDFEKPTVTEQDKIMAQVLIHSCYDRHIDRQRGG